MGRPAAFTPELGAQAECLFGDGYSLRRAADEVGVSRRTLARWLVEAAADPAAIASGPVGVGSASDTAESHDSRQRRISEFPQVFGTGVRFVPP